MSDRAAQLTWNGCAVMLCAWAVIFLLSSSVSAKRPNKPPAPNRNKAQTATAHLVSQEWSGPLPPPAALERFNQIIPDGATRIMTMVEQEQAHRISLEGKALDAEVSDFKRGHFLGAAIALAALAGAVYVAHIGGSPWVSIALVGLPVAAIVQAVLRRRR